MRIMQLVKITPLQILAMAALMRPERKGIREHFAQLYPPRAEKIFLVPRITHAARRTGGAARASPTSRRHASPYKLGYNETQAGAIRKAARGSSCNSALRRDSGVGANGSVL